MITVKGPARVFKTGWWIFSTTFTTNGPDEHVHNPNRPEGLLTPSELVNLRTIVTDYWNALKKWDEGVEIKTFVYKLSDVHGRIEVLK
jgi:hypothetical protein